MSKKPESTHVYITGYFGFPDFGSRSKVHIVDSNKKPLCKYRPNPNSEFQWCANGIYFDYLECRDCKEIATKLTDVIKTVKTGVCTFTKIPDLNGMPAYLVDGQRSHLGRIEYANNWGQFMFSPGQCTHFKTSHLQEIVNFIKLLQKE